MSGSAFTFDYDFSASASESVEYTVFGETITPDTSDQTITVYATVAELQSLLTVTGGWADNVLAKIKDGEQVYPTLALSIAGVAAKYQDFDDALIAFSDSVDKPTFLDSSSVTCKSLQAYLHDPAELTSDSATSANDWLLQIPSIAIRKTEITQTPAQSLGLIISDVSVAKDEANVTPSSIKGSVRGLYEQMVNAGKVNSNTGALDLAVGDSVSFHVNYSLTTGYNFKIDTDVSTTNAAVGSAKFVISGAEYTIPADAAGLSIGASGTKKVEWKFVVA